MNRDTQENISRIFGTLAAIITIACVGLLILDYLELTFVSPVEKSQVKEMEEQVRTDAAVAAVLTAERERQTQKSLERERLAEWTRIILIISTAFFLISVTWLRSLGGKTVLSRDKLIDLRSIPAMTSVDNLVSLQLGSKKEIELDLEPISQFVALYGKEKEAAILILQKIQQQYGYLPDEALKKVCELTSISPAQIAGTSSFYAQFRRSPVGDHIIKVCHGTACHVSGIVPITEELYRHLDIKPGEDTDASGTFTVDKVACLGCCSLAPVMMIDDQTVGRLTPASACQALHSTTESTS